MEIVALLNQNLTGRKRPSVAFRDGFYGADPRRVGSPGKTPGLGAVFYKALGEVLRPLQDCGS